MVEKFTRGDLSLMKSLFSAGKDVNNWPLETRDLQGAIQYFLGKALAIYFENNNIQVPEILENNDEVGKNDD
jgi:sulfite reductase alpha subunit-like flavoprotein